MVLFFYLMQVVAGFLLFIFGASMIEDQDIVVAIIGMLLTIIGFMVAVAFTLLVDHELKRKG